MTAQIVGGLAVLCALLGLAWRIRNPEQPPTAVANEQRQRRLETQMRVQDERWFGEWYAR